VKTFLFSKNRKQPGVIHVGATVCIFWLYRVWSQSGATSDRAQQPERSRRAQQYTLLKRGPPREVV
jgi:hypothetical protein